MATLLVAAGCGGGSSAADRSEPPPDATSSATTSTTTTSTTVAATSPPPTTAPSTTAATTAPQPPPPGKVVVLDPGHNGANGSHPAEINRKVDIGTGTKECDTTGTATDGGYSESAFNFDVVLRIRGVLEAAGVTVVLTRPDDNGVGPCIDERAGIGNHAHADAAVSVHADGGPAGSRGFHVIRPESIAGLTDTIAEPSATLATIMRDTYAAETGIPTATYIGSNGIDVRGDLGGLNLSKVPKVFVECGNMRNGTDVSVLADPGGRQRIAAAIANALLAYLAG